MKTIRSLAAVLTLCTLATVACAPPPAAPAAPTSTPPAAKPAPEHHRFVLMGLPARSAYTLSFHDSAPQWLRTSVRAAAAEITEASGITFTEAAPSPGEHPAIGEIRVGVGALCGVENEAGCAVVYGFPDRLTGAEVSVVAHMATSEWQTDVVLHEMAHTVGLAHVDPAGYAPQIMGNPTGKVLGAYQPGDLEGLSRTGAGAYTPGVGAAGAASPTVVAREVVTAR